MSTDSFRFRTLPLRGQATYLAHAFKAVVKQHHGEMRPLFRRLLPADGVVVDAGGHAGQFAKLFARIAPEGRIYTFEPGSYAHSILVRAIRLNRLRNVTVRKEALGDTEGEAELTVPLKGRGSVGYGLSHLGTSARPGFLLSERVPVTTLDQFAAEHGLARLDLIKADIEGWELRLLVGGETTIRRFRPVLMLELNQSHLARAGDSLAEAWRLLSSWQYRPFAWQGGVSLAPLHGPTEGDIFWRHEG